MDNKNYIAPAFHEMFYLGGIDLMPERLGDYPLGSMDESQCREYYDRGLLFHTREDALRVRESMMRAMVDAVMECKGADSIRFHRPNCP